MRRKRVKADGGAYYHLVSRCALQQYLFTDDEKRTFVSMMRRIADFSGVEVLTYCVMSNHFHILVRVPQPREVTESELLARVATLYGDAYAKEMRERWAAFRKTGQTAFLEKEQEHLRKRMGDISPFMHVLKMRFTLWYRGHHDGHMGTLWDNRFSSTLVEGGGSLAAVAAYIDLNPVRAGLVTDPKDYHFSGYGAACSGDADARKDLSGVYGDTSTPRNQLMAAYRGLLYAKGAADLDPAVVRKILYSQEKPSLPLLLRTKIRAFSKGLAIGSKSFAASIFPNHRYAFSENRRHAPSGTRLCPDWNGIQLCSVRHLRKNTILPSA